MIRGDSYFAKWFAFDGGRGAGIVMQEGGINVPKNVPRLPSSVNSQPLHPVFPQNLSATFLRRRRKS
jgi:hypothetical protein